ncbi:MAG: hypothetical protein HQK61_03265, partial [Desulfamplus sp.]|nr:hypothetical protein [Desulfamplus sp.]
MDDLASGSTKRIVVTSADPETVAWNAEYSSFSGKLARSLRTGRSLGQAFYDAEDMIAGNPSLFKGQRPQLDDTGEGLYSSTDGVVSSSIYIGGEGVTASEPPVVTQVHPRIQLPENVASATLWVRTSPQNEGIGKVRAIVIKPGFSPSDYQGEETQFGREELEMIYSPPQKRFEVNYDRFREEGVWQILYQAQGTDGVWSDAAFGEVVSKGVKADATIAVNLNKSAYKIGDQLLFSVTANGQKSVDLYVVLMFPGGFFQCIVYPLSFGMTNSIVPYQKAVSLSGEQNFTILDINLPQGIPQGTYTCYGIVTVSGSDPWNTENWIHFDYSSFEM